MGGGKHRLVGTAGGHGEFDAANADGDEGANLQKLAADGAAGDVTPYTLRKCLLFRGCDGVTSLL